MKHPLWILNFILILLLVILLFFVIFFRQETPVFETLTPSSQPLPQKKTVSEINIAKIFEDDLFDTYIKPVPQPTPSFVAPLPTPPIPKKIHIPKDPPPQLLDPLAISIKGIVTVSNNDEKNRVIIADTKTAKSSTHKIGDIIEDAQLIKIFDNKVIFLRPNGQQEVLYLRESEAKKDSNFAIMNDWGSLVKEIQHRQYVIDVDKAKDRIQSLAGFIDILDLTTVYKQGESIGCRAGNVARGSLGNALGLQKGDIISIINDIPANNTQNRLAIYKHIMSLSPESTINVTLLRGEETVSLKYILEKSYDELPHDNVHDALEHPTRFSQQVDILQKKHTLAPTLNALQKKEQERATKKRRPALKKITSKFTE